MKLRSRIVTLHPRNVFRISRMDEAEVQNVIVQIADADGLTGYGEASPNPFYKETAADVDSKLQSAAGDLADARLESVSDIENLSARLGERLQPSKAAQCALDLALWDLLAKRKKISVTELALGMKPRAVKSCCTIGLSTAEELKTKVAELRDHPIIKIKMNASVDIGTVRYIRSQTAADLVVDANCSWGGVDVAAVSVELKKLGVLFIEQPLPPEQNERMPEVLAGCVLPVMADESCVLPENVAQMPGRFSGFNIKLVKCGGLTPALRMLGEGRRLGLTVMVGCMLETSVLIAAGAVVGQRTDYADLDGAWLLRDDPFVGIDFKKGMLQLKDQPGLGVVPGNGPMTF